MVTEAVRRKRWEVYHTNFHEIFWDRVDKSAGPEGCWPWLGSSRSNGYGRLRLHGRYELAHRLAYRFGVGEIPDDHMVCHRCDNPPCCNPAHLFVGTHADNMADRSGKLRHAHGANSKCARLSPEQVLDIRDRLSRGETAWRMASDYGVHPTAIYRIRDGKTWAALKALDSGEG